MKLIVTKNAEESYQKAAEMIENVVLQKPNAKLGLATGGTTVGIYRCLVQRYQDKKMDFSQIRTVNLDEYVGLSGEHIQSYRYFMNNHLFNHINIDKNNTFVASGIGDPIKNIKELEDKIYEGGAPDLQLLGIGENAHIAFNEPGNVLCATSHLEPLTDDTIQANARFFETRDQVPTEAITMGIQGILSAQQIVLVATGSTKKQAVASLIHDHDITTQKPATFLKLHHHVTVMIDQELMSLI